MVNFQLPTPNFQFPIPNFQRTRTFVVSAFAVAALGMAVLPAVAHHSFAAEFDENKPVKLTGKVVEMRWSNPHAWIYMDVTTAGKVERWAFETGAANNLFRRGWRKEDLPAGTVLVIQGWQARNGSNTANAASITFPDGRRLFAGSSNPNAEK
jgi:hypothetical protein